MASRCGHWVWSLGGALNDMISGQCVLTSLPSFRTFFQLHHDQSSSIHCIAFLPKMFLFDIHIYMYVYSDQSLWYSMYTSTPGTSGPT